MASTGKDSAGELSWDAAVEYRKQRLPSYVDRETGVRHLMSYRSKVGRFMKDNKVNRACSCGDGVVSDFIPFGSAITSTFKLQITLISVFAVLTALAIPAIVINTFGVTAVEGGTAVFSIATTTVGNLPIIPAANATEAYIDLPYTKQRLSIPRAAVIYAALDLIGVVVFVLAYGVVRQGLATEDKQVNKNNIGPERYSVFLPWVPADTTEEELRTWAVDQSKSKAVPDGYAVADVNVVDDDVGLLRLYVQRGAMYRGLARLDRAIRDVKAAIGDRKARCCFDGEYAKLRALEKSFKLLKDRADKTSEAAKAFKSSGATAAFVTYDNEAGKKAILAKFPPSTFAYLCQAKKRALKGHKVVVKAAPAPDTVQWQNLNIKSGSQTARQCATGLAAACLILFSFLFIVYASLTSASVQESVAPPKCLDMGAAFSNGTYTNATLLAMGESERPLRCYCTQNLAWTKRTWDDITGDPYAPKCPEQSCTALLGISPVSTVAIGYCYSWLYNRAVAIGWTVGASVSIAVVNIVLSTSMRFMTTVEGHHSSDDLNKSLVLRLFFAQFLNTAVLTLIINAAWDTITGVDLPIPGTGKFDDFTKGWYNSVGASFHSTMITLAISPHIGTVLGMLGKFRAVKGAQTQIDRRKAIEEEKRAEEAAAGGDGGESGQGASSTTATKGKSSGKGKGKKKALPKPLPVPPKFAVQADLNESFVGPPADYVLRYVQMLNTIFVCYIFSAGMPLLMPIACGSLVMSHLVDKAAFLYFHKRPPASNNGVVRYAVELLPVAALLHLGIGIWMLGSLSTVRDALLAATGMEDTFAAAQAAGAAMLKSGMLRTGFKRITQVQSIPLLVLFALVLTGLALQVVLMTAGTLVYNVLDGISGGRMLKLKQKIAKCCKKKKEADTPLYSAAIVPPLVGTPGGINGVKSYNVLENPDLQQMFGISPAFAASHKGLRSVATFSAQDAIAAANSQDFLQQELLRARALLAMQSGPSHGNKGHGEGSDGQGQGHGHGHGAGQSQAHGAGHAAAGQHHAKTADGEHYIGDDGEEYLDVPLASTAGHSTRDTAARVEIMARKRLQMARNKLSEKPAPGASGAVVAGAEEGAVAFDNPMRAAGAGAGPVTVAAGTEASGGDPTTVVPSPLAASAALPSAPPPPPGAPPAAPEAITVAVGEPKA